MAHSKVRNISIRYSLLIFGLYIMAGGVAFSVKSDLGVSPISSIPYVVSLMTDFTIGELTAIMNTVLLVLQLILLRSNFPKTQLLQIPIGIAFGYLIDLNLIIIEHYAPSTYAEQWILCIASFMLLGLGVFCEVKADVAMLPGEGFVRAVTEVTKAKFSRNKVIVDSSLVILAVIISFVYFTHLHGVREGTIAAAIAVGFFAGIFLRKITILDRHLVTEPIVNTPEIQPGANS